jgi:hypothetical protein
LILHYRTLGTRSNARHSDEVRKGDDYGLPERASVQTTAVIVHYGDVAPTVALAGIIAPWVNEVVVAVNDDASAPAGLPVGVDWVVMERNLGYGAAFMHAVHAREGDVFILLNNDVEFTQSSFEACLEALRSDPTIGVVGRSCLRSDMRLGR